MARELTEPRLEKFNKEGDEHTGVLVEIETSNINGKPVPKFLMEDAKGDLFFILGTEDLKKKIRRNHVGLALSVKWEATEAINGQQMRRFKVMASS